MAIFSGCAGIFELVKDDFWTKYVENNETMAEISFMKLANAPKIGVVGEAHIKKELVGIYTREKIGDIVALENNGFTSIILDENGKSVISPLDASLKSSKNIKLYLFGGSMIETINYNSVNLGVCEAFAKSKPVMAKSVTNYYFNNELFTTSANIEILGITKHNVKNLKFLSLPKDLKNNKIADFKTKFTNEVVNKDLEKQRIILKNLICLKY